MHRLSSFDAQLDRVVPLFSSLLQRANFRFLSGGLIIKASAIGIRTLITTALLYLFNSTEAGYYFLGSSIIQILTPLVFMGITPVLLREVTLAHKKEDYGTIWSWFDYHLIYLGTIALCATPILWFSAPYLVDYVYDGNPKMLKVVQYSSLSLLPITLMWNSQSFFRGMGHHYRAYLAEDSLLMIVHAITLYPLISKYGILGAIISYVVGAYAAAIWGIWSCFRLIPKANRKLINRPYQSFWLKGWPVICSAFLLRLFTWGGSFTLSIISMEWISAYTVIINILTLPIVATGVIGNVYTPQWVVAADEDNRESLASSSRKASRYTFIVVAGLSLGAIVFANPLLKYVFNLTDPSIVFALRIALFVAMLRTVYGHTSLLLDVTNHAQKTLISFFLSLVTFVPILYFGVIEFGLLGAVSSYAITLVVMSFWGNIFVQRDLHIHPGLWGRPKES